ncbi:MAG: UDP-N-acetylglucosamine 2-epimerase [Pirellulales bacterium]
MPVLRAFITFGTRPEAIKMAPIMDECRRRAGQIEAIVCLSGQHHQLLSQVTDYFNIRADVDLALMRPGQSPAELTARCLAQLDRELARIRPDCLVVDGGRPGRILAPRPAGACRSGPANGQPAGSLA